ncbi:Inositol phosphatase SIW14 [Paecilomyces lecythidis]
MDSRDFLGPADPARSLRLSQEAPGFLRNNAIPNGQFPLLQKPETMGDWIAHEQHFLACLRTGDDKSAHIFLDRLAARFGPSNERVMGLRGLYQEAVAENTKALEDVLRGYDEILVKNPANVPILKRRVALLRSMSRVSDAISALVEFVEAFPTDAEAWCELADLYQSQGMSSQAIFCVEEALLTAPNAWNLHALLGELQYISALSTHADAQEDQQRLVVDSFRQFCRSVELCDDYLRGFYGIKVTSSFLLDNHLQKGDNKVGKSNGKALSKDVVERLNILATKKLKDAVEKRQVDIQGLGPGQGELAAVQELLKQH